MIVEVAESRPNAGWTSKKKCSDESRKIVRHPNGMFRWQIQYAWCLFPVYHRIFGESLMINPERLYFLYNLHFHAFVS